MMERMRYHLMVFNRHQMHGRISPPYCPANAARLRRARSPPLDSNLKRVLGLGAKSRDQGDDVSSTRASELRVGNLLLILCHAATIITASVGARKVSGPSPERLTSCAVMISNASSWRPIYRELVRNLRRMPDPEVR